VSCPNCGEVCEPSDRFCEACGSALRAIAGEAGRSSSCPDCGTQTDAAGLCPRCGSGGLRRGDRRETDLGPVMAISDRGRVRVRNEDAYAVLVENRHMAAVVCDGVSTTDDSGRAALAASESALTTLASGLAEPETWPDLAAAAVAEANRTLSFLPQAGKRSADPGSTTIALALVRAGEVVVANVGDSRAYWIGREGESVLLTVDDSWEHFARDAGFSEMEAKDPARAMRSPLGSVRTPIRSIRTWLATGRPVTGLSWFAPTACGTTPTVQRTSRPSWSSSMRRPRPGWPINWCGRRSTQAGPTT
jgi:hypothetical protein